MHHTRTRFIGILLSFLCGAAHMHAAGIRRPEQDDIAQLEQMRTQLESRWGVQLDIGPEELGPLVSSFSNLNTGHHPHRTFVTEFVSQLDQWSHPSARDVREQALAVLPPFIAPNDPEYSLQALQLFYNLYADKDLSEQTRANRLEQARQTLALPLPGQQHPPLADILFPPQNDD